MLDREPIALQCSLLSAQACGVTSVQDYRQHEDPSVTPSLQRQQASSHSDADAASDNSRSSSQQHASTSQVCAGLTPRPRPACDHSLGGNVSCAE